MAAMAGCSRRVAIPFFGTVELTDILAFGLSFL
jgi:hypothetical protein